MPSTNRLQASYILSLQSKSCGQINVTCKDHLSVADGPSHSSLPGRRLCVLVVRSTTVPSAQEQAGLETKMSMYELGPRNESFAGGYVVTADRSISVSVR